MTPATPNVDLSDGAVYNRIERMLVRLGDATGDVVPLARPRPDEVGRLEGGR